MYSETPDIQAFNRLFSEYRRKFIYFAFTYLNDYDMAEDVVMEAFLYYWEKRDSISPEPNLQVYLLKVVKNKCLNHLRARSIRLRVNTAIRDHELRVLETDIRTLEAFEPKELFTAETREAVQKALDSMPEQTRKIFMMNRFDNMKYREIADASGLSVKAVEFHISKALKIMRAHLKGYAAFAAIFLTDILG